MREEDDAATDFVAEDLIDEDFANEEVVFAGATVFAEEDFANVVFAVVFG